MPRKAAPKKPASAVPVAPQAAPPPPAPGTWRLDQMVHGQCRYPCTPSETREHLFCGEPAVESDRNPHRSWCTKHLPIVFTERLPRRAA